MSENPLEDLIEELKELRLANITLESRKQSTISRGPSESQEADLSGNKQKRHPWGQCWTCHKDKATVDTCNNGF